ncbi:ABC transporter ATP-binding protein [Clostridium aestuarii]|uniref:ABC transporter ATP-binding protein n=1 Tax=Clostridium aestuarii TaxID=338193 RepID=A0ABT4D4Z1_9CLOT|nr:ABC transporter ATP-binding protein [Clostridium aestuarii]MCY6485108.1 ABC transporter ATP-binding protein [Clostridium aestuarii]
MAGVKIRNLFKVFNIESRRVKALSSVDLDIEDGSFVTIVGKSGCGKTTLLRILCGLEEKTEGEIIFDDYDKEKLDSLKVSIVFQEARLMPWLTVKENMAFPLIKNLNKDQIEEKVNGYLEMLGLTKFKNAYPSQISGGMAQRTALGRTLCYNPDVILMDEPLGALDAFNRRKLQNEIIDIFLKHKKTIIFVTHDVDEAVYLGQKVVMMDKGKVIKEIPVKLSYPREISSREIFNIREEILNYLFN